MSLHTEKESQDVSIRCETAIEALTSLVKYNDNRLELTGDSLAGRFSFKRFFATLYWTYKISSIECEIEELIRTLKDANNFTDAIDALVATNDFLYDVKPTFIKYIKITDVYKGEDPEVVFNSLTFGGSV